MKVFVAGVGGVIGRSLVPLLVGRGHEVTGLTRSPAKRELLERLGASPVVADALDAGAVREAVGAARPDVLVHVLTALPRGGPRRYADFAATDRLRHVATGHLVAAASAAGCRRMVAESMIAVYGDDGGVPAGEDAGPAAPSGHAPMAATVAALRSLETQVGTATGIEGVVLRYGALYGPEAGTGAMLKPLRRRRLPLPPADGGAVSMIHEADAATATLAVVEADAPPAVLNVTDDEPVSLPDFVRELARLGGAPRPWTVPSWLAHLAAPVVADMARARLRASNARIKAALGWSPAFPTYREGLADVVGAVAR